MRDALVLPGCRVLSVQTLVTRKATFTHIGDVFVGLHKKAKLQSCVNWAGKTFYSVSNPIFGSNSSLFFLFGKKSAIVHEWKEQI